MAGGCNKVASLTLVDSNLDHIYFFMHRNDEPPTVKDTHTSNKTPSSTTLMNHHQHDSSLSSTESGASNNAGSRAQMNPLATEFMPMRNPSDPPLPASPPTLSELRQTPDKGLGLFAIKFIPRGSLIMCEPPLLQIQDNALHKVWSPYCCLGATQKQIYNGLHSFSPQHLHLEQASRLHLIDYGDDSLDEEDVEDLVAEHVRVMSIFSPNNFKMGSSGLAIYATASRLNHSCVPNVHHSYNPTLESLTVYAARDILPNEELLTTYIGCESYYETRMQRIETLYTVYGFTCNCPACADPTGLSDRRRQLLRNIRWGLNEFFQGNTIQHPYLPPGPASALKQSEDFISILLQEGIITMELAKAYRAASTCAFQLCDFDKALEYAHNEATVEKNCLGEVIRDLRKIRAATEQWIEKIYETVRLQRGKAVVREYRNKAKRAKKAEKKAVQTQ